MQAADKLRSNVTSMSVAPTRHETVCNLPVMVTLSPGLHASTFVSKAYISRLRGVSPSGMLVGSSCILMIYKQHTNGWPGCSENTRCTQTVMHESVLMVYQSQKYRVQNTPHALLASQHVELGNVTKAKLSCRSASQTNQQ